MDRIAEPTKTVVLVSGGMDSVTALYDACANAGTDVVAALSFNYGSKHNDREIPYAQQHCRELGIPHRIVQADFMNSLFTSSLLQNGGEIPEGHYEAEIMTKTIVPFRNGIMLAIAAGFAESIGAKGIVIAAHYGDRAVYPDCRNEFLDAMDDAIYTGTTNSAILLRPFISMNKAEIVSRGIELGINYASTWTCYKGGAVHCGKCGTCVERREAFMDADVTDPTEYSSTDPLPPKPERS